MDAQTLLIGWQQGIGGISNGFKKKK